MGKVRENRSDPQVPIVDPTIVKRNLYYLNGRVIKNESFKKDFYVDGEYLIQRHTNWTKFIEFITSLFDQTTKEKRWSVVLLSTANTVEDLHCDECEKGKYLHFIDSAGYEGVLIKERFLNDYRPFLKANQNELLQGINKKNKKFLTGFLKPEDAFRNKIKRGVEHPPIQRKEQVLPSQIQKPNIHENERKRIEEENARRIKQLKNDYHKKLDTLEQKLEELMDEKQMIQSRYEEDKKQFESAKTSLDLLKAEHNQLKKNYSKVVKNLNESSLFRNQNKGWTKEHAKETFDVPPPPPQAPPPPKVTTNSSNNNNNVIGLSSDALKRVKLNKSDPTQSPVPPKKNDNDIGSVITRAMEQRRFNLNESINGIEPDEYDDPDWD